MARMMVYAPNGDLFVSSPNTNSMTVLRDTNSVGVFESRSTYGQGRAPAAPPPPQNPQGRGAQPTPPPAPPSILGANAPACTPPPDFAVQGPGNPRLPFGSRFTTGIYVSKHRLDRTLQVCERRSEGAGRSREAARTADRRPFDAKHPLQPCRHEVVHLGRIAIRTTMPVKTASFKKVPKFLDYCWASRYGRACTGLFVCASPDVAWGLTAPHAKPPADHPTPSLSRSSLMLRLSECSGYRLLLPALPSPSLCPRSFLRRAGGPVRGGPIIFDGAHAGGASRSHHHPPVSRALVIAVEGQQVFGPSYLKRREDSRVAAGLTESMRT